MERFVYLQTSRDIRELLETVKKMSVVHGFGNVKIKLSIE
jgi:hypothetical protein